MHLWLLLIILTLVDGNRSIRHLRDPSTILACILDISELKIYNKIMSCNIAVSRHLQSVNG